MNSQVTNIKEYSDGSGYIQVNVGFDKGEFKEVFKMVNDSNKRTTKMREELRKIEESAIRALVRRLRGY